MYYNYREDVFGTQVLSFVERFIIPCPYLVESTVRGSTI